MPEKATYPYRLFCNGLAASVEIPAGFTSEQWGTLQEAFLCRAEPDAAERQYTHVWTLGIDRQWMHAGVPWHEELANRDGCSYVLMPTFGTSAEAIEACENHIRRKGDVVRMRVLRPKEELPEKELSEMLTAAIRSDIPGKPKSLGNCYLHRMDKVGGTFYYYVKPKEGDTADFKFQVMCLSVYDKGERIENVWSYDRTLEEANDSIAKERGRLKCLAPYEVRIELDKNHGKGWSEKAAVIEARIRTRAPDSERDWRLVKLWCLGPDRFAIEGVRRGLLPKPVQDHVFV